MFHIIKRDGVYHYKNLKIWAEGGLVHVEDTRTGDYGAESVREALQKTLALSEMIGNSGRNRTDAKEWLHYNDAVEALQTLVENLIAVCEAAKEQGEPGDPVADHEHARRLPKTFIQPRAAATF